MSEDTGETKKHEASRRKLDKLRKDGQISQSRDLSAFLALTCGIGFIVIGASFIYRRIERIFDTALKEFAMPFENMAVDVAAAVTWELGMIVAPLMGIMIGVSLITSIVHNEGFVFAMKQVAPDLGKISPAAGLKRIFGVRGWIEAAFAGARLMIWFFAVMVLIAYAVPDMLKIVPCGLSCAPVLFVDLSLKMVAVLLGILIISGVIDVVVQRHLFLQEQRMTDTEVKRESKEQYGSPEMRSERRRLQREAAAAADHIGVDRANMCFFSDDMAVALRYHPEHAPVPRVTAKGTREQAAELRTRVRANGFPELEQPKITRSCMRLDPGATVGEDIFADLAKAMQQMFG